MTVSMPLRLAALACAGALLLLAPAPAAAWNAATHAWLTRGLHGGWQHGRCAERDLADLIYGANAFDLLNNDFTAEGQAAQQALHATAGDLFLSPWWAAEGRAEAAFALGFATHNNAWGADATAHVAGRTVPRHAEGWIIGKARALAPILDPALRANGLVLDEATLLLVSHILVEQAVDDLLVARDPTLPPLLLQTALARDPAVPGLLARALAPDLAPYFGSAAAAAERLVLDEALFRQATIAYGWALMQPDARALVAGGIGDQAEAFLGLPPGSGPALVPLIDWAIGQAMTLCEPDYMDELRATRGWLQGRLLRHGLRP
jgi:hypothetical protein